MKMGTCLVEPPTTPCMSKNKIQSTSKKSADERTVISRVAHGVSSRGKSASETAVVPSSTLRALQLRNGKGGSFGLGEVMSIAGREKLELLAEDEMEKAEKERRSLYEANINSSLRAPFRLETVLNIAQSQMDAYIDFINALHKPDLCYDIVSREIQAQCPPRSSRDDPGAMSSPSFVAEQFGICVHNGHMLASGWVILYESFRKLQDLGLGDRQVSMQLKTNEMIHDIYRSAYDLLKKLVSADQHRLRSIAQNTPHYAPYFKNSSESKGCQEFEIAEMKRMYKSFLDSAIIELCLPGSRYSPQALYFCLRATVEESPKLLKRCPQLMWDAIGDLAEAVRLMDIMETPLTGQDFISDERSPIFNEFVRWDQAQAASIRSALQFSSYVNLVYPLENLQSEATLDKVWDRLNANYVRESGQNIDALWQLVDARHRVPRFSTLTVPEDMLFGHSENSNKALVRHDPNAKRKTAVVDAEYDGNNSASSMPALRAVSDSEDEFQQFDSTDGDDDGSSYFEEDEEDLDDDEYDEDQDQELKRQQREAIDKFMEDPDILDPGNTKYAEEKKDNPLLSLLGNLRGRLFPSSPILRTDGVTTATSKPASGPSSEKPTTKVPTPAKGTNEQTSQSPEPSGPSAKALVEDADDENDVPRHGTVKKKKKPKKKKKKSPSEVVDLPTVEIPVSPVPRSPSPLPASATVEPVSPVSPTSPRKGKRPVSDSPSVKSQIKSDLSGIAAYASTTTLHLPLPQEERAPSARLYLQQIQETKTKVKTRRDQPVEVPPSEKRVRNLFGRLRGKDRDKEDAQQKDNAGIFARLTRKTASHARRLFGVSAQDKKGSLKWEQFLQVMRELGFEYDPSTAGSSVRFDPPDPNDRSISFHKPHPDPTLHQNVLKRYRDKLESYYGWSPDKFQKAVEGVGGVSSEEGDD